MTYERYNVQYTGSESCNVLHRPCSLFMHCTIDTHTQRTSYIFFKLKIFILFNAIKDSTGTRRVLPESSELTRTMSRTEAVKQDVRKLKSMTLDRMGKMFKSRTSTLERSSLGLDNVSDLDT